MAHSYLCGGVQAAAVDRSYLALALYRQARRHFSSSRFSPSLSSISPYRCNSLCPLHLSAIAHAHNLTMSLRSSQTYSPRVAPPELVSPVSLSLNQLPFYDHRETVVLTRMTVDRFSDIFH